MWRQSSGSKLCSSLLDEVHTRNKKDSKATESSSIIPDFYRKRGMKNTQRLPRNSTQDPLSFEVWSFG